MFNALAMRKLGVGLSFLLTLACLKPANAQVDRPLEENYWYFGNSSQAILFDKGNLPLIEAELIDNQVTPFGTGGSAVISNDETGDLLFYSDGTDIYDPYNQSVLDGTPLNGNPQLINPVVASPIPGTPRSFYVFTNSGAGGVNEIQYTIVNALLDGNKTDPDQPPFGDATATINASTGINNPSDAMIIVPGEDNDYWFINQDVSSGEFRVMGITDSGFGAVQTFDLFNINVPSFEVSAFAFNPDSSLLAVAPKEQNRNVIILNFDRSSGVLSFNTQVLNSGNADSFENAIADIAWSGDGLKLFISRLGTADTSPNSGMLYQFGLDTLSILRQVLDTTVYRSYGIKRGPDNRIYHLYQQEATTPLTLGRIDRPDSIDNVAYDSLPLGNTQFNGFYFPQHAPAAPTPFTLLDFSVTDSITCTASEMFFTPRVEPTPEFVSWDFGDGNSSNAFSPIHSYEMEYSGPVTMRVGLNGVFGEVTKNVTVQMNSLMVDLGNDTTICPGEQLVLDPFANSENPPTPGTQFSWNTGETTPTIMANSDTTRTYWVYVQDPSGCTAFDEIIVTVYGDETQVLNHWYFGRNAGINFTPQATALDDGAMVAPEGAATVSDRNGELLFYTNGSTVWNRDHEVMANGTNLGGDSTVTQAAMIVPVSGVTAAGEQSATIFYIFMPDKIYGNYSYDMRYAIVDIKQDSAKGAVIVKNQPLFKNSTERITASGFGTGNTWAIGHEYGNNTFRAYSVGSQGIEAPTVSSEGSIHEFREPLHGKGYMKLASNGELLGVALPGNGNRLEIFEFDSIGQVSDGVSIDINEPGAEVYGLEFSSDTRKVYITTNKASSRLIQYSLDSLGTDNAKADIEATKLVVFSGGQSLGAIQTGPDRQVYVAVENSQSLGIINGPTSDNPSFSPTAFPLLGGTASLLGLPNFVQSVSNPPSSPSIGIANACFGQPVEFSGTGTSDIDEYDWIWGDNPAASFPDNPDTLMVQNPTHLYADLGAYEVQLRVYNRCGFDSVLVDTLQINPLPNPLNLESPQNICQDPFLDVAALPTDSAGFTYTWSTGDTTRVVRFTEATQASVFVTNQFGCSSDPDTVFIANQRPDLALGPDFTACESEELADIDGSNGQGGLSYEWFINGQVVGTDRFQSVDTDVPGDFIYILEVFEPITSCTATDTLQVSVLEEPRVTAIETFPSTCGNATGRLSFELTGDGNFVYGLSGPTSVSPRVFNNVNPVTIDSLAAGIYQLSVTNTVNGCTSTQNIAIEDLAAFDLATSQAGICALDIRLSGNVADSVLVSIVDEDGLNVTAADGTLYDGSVPFASSAFINSPFEVGVSGGGQFSIAVQEIGGAGCIQTDSLSLIPLEVTITAEPNCDIGGLIQLTAESTITEDVTFQWLDSAGNVISGETSAFLDVETTGVYTVNVTDVNGNCSASDFIEVLVVPITDEQLLLEANAAICSLDPNPETGTVTLDPGVFATYEWRIRGEDEVISEDRMLIVSEEGTYVVTISNGSVCVTDRVVVEDDCRPTVVAPNAFTPNGDGLNDTFAVFPNDYVTEYSIFIYSRWGELVFQSNDINFQWDGVYRGQPLPDGTYAYVMRYRSELDASQNVIEQFGGVTILR